MSRLADRANGKAAAAVPAPPNLSGWATPEWPEIQLKRLWELWHLGLSTAEIGRRLGVSKNAAVSKANRMGLPARASPIIRTDDRWRTPPVQRFKAGASTLPPLASQAT